MRSQRRLRHATDDGVGAFARRSLRCVAIVTEPDATVTVAGAAPVAVPAVPDFEERRVGLRAPQARGAVTVTLTWRQTSAGVDGEAVTTCDGTITATAAALAPSAKIGDLTAPRVDGEWSVNSTMRGMKPQRSAMRLRARCAKGACPLLFHTGRAVATLELSRDGRSYRHAERALPPRGFHCGDQRTGGILLRNAFRPQQTWELDVSRSRELPDGTLEAVRLDGYVTLRFVPTAAARRLGCRAQPHEMRLVFTRR